MVQAKLRSACAEDREEIKDALTVATRNREKCQKRLDTLNAEHARLSADIKAVQDSKDEVASALASINDNLRNPVEQLYLSYDAFKKTTNDTLSNRA